MAEPTLPLPIGRQKDVLYLPSQGHFVVLGTAGSGKTTLAILRAAYLGNPNTDNSGRTLLVTFNRALVSYLKHFQGTNFRNVSVENYHLFARGYLASRGRMRNNSICEGKLRELLIGRAILAVARASGNHSICSRSLEFFSREIEWIQQHGIGSALSYTEAERIGRAEAPLDRKSRAIVFHIYQEYLSLRMAERKDFDWDDMANAVCEEFDHDTSKRFYKHVVVDEGHRGDRRTLTTKQVRETEAEAVAFVVCQSVGLQNGTASQDYIQLWHGDANLLRESLEAVQQTAAVILGGIAPEPAALAAAA